jgi:hypothetical protein
MNEVTITLSAADAWWLRSFCIDSAGNWMVLRSQVHEGLRPDLDETACERLRDRAIRFAKMLEEAGAAL